MGENKNKANSAQLKLELGLSLAKSFKKIRVNRQKPNKELNALFERKESLKLLLNDEHDEETVEAIEAKLEKVSDEIAVMCAEKNKDIGNGMLGRNSG